MVVRQRQSTTHQLVAVSAGEVVTRCGLTFRKPKVGHGKAVVFGATCAFCSEATQELLATSVAEQ